MPEANSHLWMLEAAMFQFRAAAATIEDESTAAPLRLAASVLENSIAGARNGVSAAVVNDIVFALGDVEGAMGELTAADYERLARPFELLRRDIESLRAAATLPGPLVARIHALQGKLKARRAAIERQTMVEGGGSEALPHAPEELREEALPIREQLAAAGFSTPALDTLIEEPSSLRFHSINAIVDELDVIAG